MCTNQQDNIYLIFFSNEIIDHIYIDLRFLLNQILSDNK